MTESGIEATLEAEGAALPSLEPSAPEPREYVPPADDEELAVEEGVEDDDEPPGPRAETEEEILEPKVDAVSRVLTDTNGQSREYTQRDFLYFQQMEMYGILGRATQIVLDGDLGLGTNDIMDMLQPKKMLDDFMSRLPGYEDAPDRADNEVDQQDAIKMMSAFARVVSASPDLLKEAYICILDIPKAHRKWAMDWSLDRIDRETGNDIMHTFIDQNWGILEGFFTEELPRVVRRAVAARRRHRESSGRR